MRSPEQLKGWARNVAAEKHLRAQEILQMFMFERLLERLAASPYQKNFILKGGLLISSMVGLEGRTTMDMDTTVRGIHMEEEEIVSALKTILAVDVGDGIRKVSDDLCRQNQLSVIETDGRGISYGEWRNRREGKPTLRGMVKADVEMALAESSDFDDFVGKLQKMGYEVKYGPRVKHMAVRHQDSKRFVRLDGVAPQFSEAELRAFFTQLKKLPPEMQQEYQAENQPVQQSWQKEPELPVVRRVRCRSRLNRPYKKVGGIMACYYHYCALLRRNYRGRSGRRCYYLLREDFSKFNRYRRQCDLLWEQKIESTEELRTYKARLTHELEVLTQKRKYLYNHKEVLTPDVRNRRLEELSARMRTVRRELNTCTDIETDAAALLLKWQEVRQAEKEEREVNENEQRRRSR